MSHLGRIPAPSLQPDTAYKAMIRERLVFLKAYDQWIAVENPSARDVADELFATANALRQLAIIRGTRV